MIYVVAEYNGDYNYGVYIGYSHEKTFAEDYMTLLKYRAKKLHKDVNLTYRIREFSDDVFNSERSINKDLARCPEIYMYGDDQDVPLTDDDYEFIANVMNDKDTELDICIEKILDILVYYDTPTCNKLCKLLKRLRKEKENDNDGSLFYDRLNWEKVAKKIIM